MIIPVALNNIKYRTNIDAFAVIDSKPYTLEEFIKLTKANRYRCHDITVGSPRSQKSSCRNARAFYFYHFQKIFFPKLRQLKIPAN